MHTERLLKLADFLETVPPDKFDMNGWGREDDCGFAGCAIGWAGKLFDGKGLETFPLKDCREGNYNIGVRITDDKDIVSWRAVEQFFDMEFEDADFLFSSGEYSWNVTPTEVAARIREFVARR
jgi:hypothetical protein